MVFLAWVVGLTYSPQKTKAQVEKAKEKRERKREREKERKRERKKEGRKHQVLIYSSMCGLVLLFLFLLFIIRVWLPPIDKPPIYPKRILLAYIQRLSNSP